MILYWDGGATNTNTLMWVPNNAFDSLVGCVLGIFPYDTTYSIDIPGNNAYAGQRLELWGQNGTPAQMFLIQCNSVTHDGLPGKHVMYQRGPTNDHTFAIYPTQLQRVSFYCGLSENIDD